MACASIKKNINKVCTGDLDKRIDIQTSSISPSNAPGGVATASFITITKAWALIKTTANRVFIDGVNIDNGLNTDFYIRFNSAIDFEKQLWILYNSKRFKIINPDNIDKEDMFIRLRCTEKGDESILANAR